MTRKASEWYDESYTLGPEEVDLWNPEQVADAKVQTLLEDLRIILARTQASISLEERGKLRRIVTVLKNLASLWATLAPGVNLEQMLPDFADVTDRDRKAAAKFDPEVWTHTRISEAELDGAAGVTAAIQTNRKKIANKMAFYYDREVEELDRIFSSA